MEISDVLVAIGLGLAAAGFIVGLAQYQRAQAWKAAEFVAREMEAAFDDPQVRLALDLLDWNGSRHDLRSSPGDDPSLRGMWITDATVAKALVPHNMSIDYSPVEVHIRKAFDALFDRLQRFQHFIDVGLVRPTSFRPYLGYWLDLLCTSSAHGKSIGVLHSIWRYIDAYRYQDVQRFVSNYGYPIENYPEALDAAEQYRELELAISS